MNDTVRVAINQSTPSRCEIGNAKHRAQEEIVARRSLVSRMIRLVFKRKQRTTEQRAKSWPGCQESVSVPVPVSTTTSRQSSATIAIPSSVASSAPSTIQTTCTRQQRIRKRTVDDNCCEAPWRQRQTHCANCELLFFTALSTLNSGADRFCSLDCKTNFKYLTQLQEAMDEQMLGTNSVSSCLFDDDDFQGKNSCCVVEGTPSF